MISISLVLFVVLLSFVGSIASSDSSSEDASAASKDSGLGGTVGIPTFYTYTNGQPVPLWVSSGSGGVSTDGIPTVRGGTDVIVSIQQISGSLSLLSPATVSIAGPVKPNYPTSVPVSGTGYFTFTISTTTVSSLEIVTITIDGYENSNVLQVTS